MPMLRDFGTFLPGGAALLAAVVLPLPALAQNGGAGDGGWLLSLDAGASGAKGDFDQHSYNGGLSRFMGDGYLSVLVARLTDDGIEGSLVAVPNATEQVGIGGGYAFGALSLDLSATYGWRKFDTARRSRRNGNTLTETGKGEALALGGSVTYEAPVGERTTLLPAITLDYDRSDTARVVIPLVGPPFVFKRRQSGVTGGASLTLQRSFGPAGEHSISGYVGALTTSNAAAGGGSFTGRRGVVRTLRPRVASGSKETWGEAGTNVSFARDDVLSLTFSAGRTLGLTGPDTTSLSAGLQFGF